MMVVKFYKKASDKEPIYSIPVLKSLEIEGPDILIDDSVVAVYDSEMGDWDMLATQSIETVRRFEVTL